MIRRNCSEPYNEFLESYFFNLRQYLFRVFWIVTFEKILKKKSNRPVFVNINLAFFFLAACANSSVDSFPCKYMPSLWPLIWSNHVSGSWYLIIWLETIVQSSEMDYYFFKLTVGSHCLELCFWTPSLSKPSWLSNITKYQSLSYQSFKHNSTHMPSLNLTPALSFERRFSMFIIKVYYTKSNASNLWAS